MRYEARAPLRIDFGGGWTDVPMYAQHEGGAVLNAAITRYVRGVISRPEASGILHALRGDRSYLRYSLDVPSGAGLGASAAQTVLWVTLVRSSIANDVDRHQIAEMACQVAASLGILGGKQDEYAAALGGIGYYTFGDSVTVQRLELPSSLTGDLAARLVLVYSGQRHLSSTIHEHVWGGFEGGDRQIRDALASLRRLAGEMRDALLAGDLIGFGRLLSANWMQQKRLHPSIHNPTLDALFDHALSHGAIGGKACGAGGGGCLVFLAAEAQAEPLRHAFSQRKVPTFDVGFDTYGVYFTKG